MHIVDNSQQEVIRIIRPFMCCAAGGCYGCSDGCNPELHVEAPVGQYVGTVKGRFFCCDPSFVVRDESGSEIFSIDGPNIWCWCCDDVEFKVTDVNTNQHVASVTKQWSGFCTEYFTDADNFSISCKFSMCQLSFFLNQFLKSSNTNGRSQKGSADGCLIFDCKSAFFYNKLINLNW